MINYNNLAIAVSRRTGVTKEEALSYLGDGYLKVDKSAPEAQQAAYMLHVATGAALNEFKKTCTLLDEPEGIYNVPQEDQHATDAEFSDQFGEPWTNKAVSWIISRRAWKKALNENTLSWWLSTQGCENPVKTARRVYSTICDFAKKF